MAQQMLPDVVISDVMMPRLDGYGLLQKLRADERLGGTPVIFLTAKGMTADRTQGYLAGVDDYIPKPFDPDELVARVRNVAQRQQRLLQEAARFADTDMGQMAKQITEIRSLLAQANPICNPYYDFYRPRDGAWLDQVFLQAPSRGSNFGHLWPGDRFAGNHQVFLWGQPYPNASARSDARELLSL